jgi:purine-binding chemotaxis protein CheW
VIGARQFCTFFVDNNTFGLDIRHVREVLPCTALTPIPLAPPAIRGLVNLRGEIITALDLRELLGLPPPKGVLDTMHVIAHTHDDTFSLLVDKVGDVIEISEESFYHTPNTLPERVRKLLHGVYRLPNTLLLSIDIQQISNAVLNAVSTAAS